MAMAVMAMAVIAMAMVEMVMVMVMAMTVIVLASMAMAVMAMAVAAVAMAVMVMVKAMAVMAMAIVGDAVKRRFTMRKVEIGSEKYTQVFACDEKEFNAHHKYSVSTTKEPSVILASIDFQKGAIKEYGVNGVMNEDLIAMVIDRLNSFQESQYKCRENAIAITKLEEALLWLRKRTMDRERRQVEGTHLV
jgi:hypothetical protein